MLHSRQPAVLETMLYDCVTSPRACHYDTLRQAHHSFLTRCIGWRKNNRTDRSICYLNTLIKTGSEIEHRGDFAQEANPVRGICGAHGGHETAGVHDVRRTSRGRGLRWGPGKRVNGVSVVHWGVPPALRTAGNHGRTTGGTGDYFLGKGSASDQTRARPHLHASGVTDVRATVREKPHGCTPGNWKERVLLFQLLPIVGTV